MLRWRQTGCRCKRLEQRNGRILISIVVVVVVVVAVVVFVVGLLHCITQWIYIYYPTFGIMSEMRDDNQQHEDINHHAPWCIKNFLRKLSQFWHGTEMSMAVPCCSQAWQVFEEGTWKQRHERMVGFKKSMQPNSWPVCLCVTSLV